MNSTGTNIYYDKNNTGNVSEYALEMFLTLKKTPFCLNIERKTSFGCSRRSSIFL